VDAKRLRRKTKEKQGGKEINHDLLAAENAIARIARTSSLPASVSVTEISQVLYTLDENLYKKITTVCK